MQLSTSVRPRPTRVRVGLLTAVTLLVVTLLAACQQQLTPDGKPYAVAVVGSTLRVTNTASGPNDREALWSSTAATALDSQQCARWVSGAGATQNGLAFRIRSDSGGWDAIVLERNIYFAAYWGFRVIYFHSGSNQRTRFDEAPQGADLGDYLGRRLAPTFPLRVCASLSGTVLRFAVAKGNDPMVPVGTPGRGATLYLNPPAPDRQAGQTGTYIAHVPAGTTAVVDSMTINGRPAPMPNT